MHGGALGSLHIRGGTLVCMDAARTVRVGDLLAENGAISALAEDVPVRLTALPGRRAEVTVDAAGAYVLPGFVHGHLHLCQTLFRGLAEQSDLLDWLRDSIWPLEAAHTQASLEASVQLGLVELIAGGVTCVNDMGTVRHTEVIARAVDASGMRAIVGKALMDTGAGVPEDLREEPDVALHEALALADQFHGAGGGRIQVSLAPRFILSCSDGLWRAVASASKERGLRIHTHLAESPGEGAAVTAAVGTSAARYFQSRGVLCERFVGAHGVWVEDDERTMLADADAVLVHCPSANLKLGSGLARVRGWLDHGIRCGLGADGAACNNRLDTFQEMTLAAGISRVTDPARALTAREIVALATCDGAKALGLFEQIGSLEVGKQADVAVIDAGGVHQSPNASLDPYTSIVHAARCSDVRMTAVAGRVLYEQGEWKTLDATHAKRTAEAASRALVARARLAERR